MRSDLYAGRWVNVDCVLGLYEAACDTGIISLPADKVAEILNIWAFVRAPQQNPEATRETLRRAKGLGISITIPPALTAVLL